MATEFIVQASDPRASSECDPDDRTLSDAIESIFPMDTERLLMTWNGVYVPLGYKYDVSLMVDDIVDLCDHISSRTEGRREIHWPTNTFASVWDVRWTSTVVTIQAQWARVVGGTESMLANKPHISVPRADFLAEWRRPLEIVRDALRKAGYTIEQIPRLAALDEVVAAIPDCGILYRG